MGRIQTPITGITTSSTYEDGTAYSLVNLRPKNGALHPVAPRKVIQELSQDYDIVFVHQNNDYKNWIGVKSDNNYSSIYWDILSEHPKTIASYIQAKIHSVEQIGNTLSFVTDSNIYYAWYTNGNYVYLDEMPQVPPIQFGTHTQTHASYYFINEYGKGGVNKENFIEATKGLVNKAMDLLMNGGTVNEEHFPGYGLQLFDACFIRYAYRLYDGTITKQSPPILAMPRKDILETKTIDYAFINGRLAKHSKVDVYGHRLSMRYDFTNIGEGGSEKWQDIIKSIDIFISAPIGISNIENMRKDLSTKGFDDIPSQIEDDVDNDLTPPTFNLIKEITTEALKNVANTSTFYLVRSIELGKQSGFEPDMLPSQDADFTKMENLIYQEVMKDDNFSNHKYGASRSYVYNNRLHLGNLKTTFFKGFHAGYFRWSNDYNATTPPEGEANYIVSEVEIYTGTSLEKVYSFYSMSYAAFSVGKLFTSAFLSYPDTRAKRMTFYEVNEDVWTKVFSTLLEPHNLLNLAYFMNDELKPILGNENRPIVAPDTSKDVTQSEPNKIKVSELNNPLSFPNLNTYQAGNGTILAMATNAMNVSDRNYGQYPLYVFTTQGIWTLNIGEGEVVYSNIPAPTYTEAPTTDIVCSTPVGVVFTTQRGLQIINGQSVNFLSPQLEQDYLDINMQLPEAQCEGVIHLFNEKSFREYLLGIDNIIYNPHESELIISDKDADYSYVLNLPSQSFYKSKERIDLLVKNIFPQLLIVGDRKIKDYAASNSPNTHICLVLRPITFGTLDIKNLERIILRGLLVNIQNVAENKKSLIMVHHSNDGVNFPATRGLTTEPCNRRDYDMGLFASSKFSQFMFSFAGVVDESSKIHFLDTQIRQEYNNTKMR